MARERPDGTFEVYDIQVDGMVPLTLERLNAMERAIRDLAQKLYPPVEALNGKDPSSTQS